MVFFLGLVWRTRWHSLFLIHALTYSGESCEYLQLGMVYPLRDDSRVFFSWLSMTVVFHVKDPQLSIFNDMVIGAMSSLVSIYFCLSCCMYLTGSVFSPTLALVNMPFIACIQGHTAYLKFLPVYVIGGLSEGSLPFIPSTLLYQFT